MRIGQSHRNAECPNGNGPSSGGRSWGHLRGNGAGAARDVQLAADHIRFAAADQHSFKFPVETVLWITGIACSSVIRALHGGPNNPLAAAQAAPRPSLKVEQF